MEINIHIHIHTASPANPDNIQPAIEKINNLKGSVIEETNKLQESLSSAKEKV